MVPRGPVGIHVEPLRGNALRSAPATGEASRQSPSLGRPSSLSWIGQTDEVATQADPPSRPLTILQGCLPGFPEAMIPSPNAMTDQFEMDMAVGETPCWWAD